MSSSLSLRVSCLDTARSAAAELMLLQRSRRMAERRLPGQMLSPAALGRCCHLPHQHHQRQSGMRLDPSLSCRASALPLCSCVVSNIHFLQVGVLFPSCDYESLQKHQPLELTCRRTSCCWSFDSSSLEVHLE